MKHNEKEYKRKEDREFQKAKNPRQATNKSPEAGWAQTHKEGRTPYIPSSLESVTEQLGGIRDAMKKASAPPSMGKMKDN